MHQVHGAHHSDEQAVSLGTAKKHALDFFVNQIFATSKCPQHSQRDNRKDTLECTLPWTALVSEKGKDHKKAEDKKPKNQKEKKDKKRKDTKHHKAKKSKAVLG